MKTLKGRLLLTILIPLIVILIFVGLFVEFGISKIVSKILEKSAIMTTHAVADLMNEWISGIIKEVRIFSRDPEVVKALKTGDWKDLIDKKLTPLAKERPYIDSFLIAYPDGSGPNTAGNVINVADRDWFVKTMHEGIGIFISNALISRATGRVMFAIALPVKDENGRIIGVFRAAVSVDSLKEILEHARLTKSAFALLVDSSGQIVVDTYGTYSMKLNIKEASKAGFGDLEKASPEVLSGKEGYIKLKMLNDIPGYCFYAPVEITKGWVLAVLVPESEVMADVYKLLRIVSISFVGLIAILSLIVFFVSSSISKPIKFFAEKVLQFGQGNLMVKFEAKGKDEVAYMANALNRMSDMLKVYIKTMGEISNKISASSQILSGASQKINASFQEVVSRIEEVSKNSQDISASVEEVTSGIEQVA
ncbi:MAG: methyl-accepting chemotaxis protein, partial [Synergistetes bacterium]|nr:methyl-accepting chemotaxis protein [Synergistota bacterium]MDW8193191.1 methyl-accepting chemotaxis protein [Synergistota bacterium]